MSLTQKRVIVEEGEQTLDMSIVLSADEWLGEVLMGLCEASMVGGAAEILVQKDDLMGLPLSEMSMVGEGWRDPGRVVCDEAARRRLMITVKLNMEKKQLHHSLALF